MHRPLQPPFPAQSAKRAKALVFAIAAMVTVVLVAMLPHAFRPVAETERSGVRPAANAAVPPIKIEKTTDIGPRLTLAGVVAGKPELALIRIDGQRQRAFATGQEIMPGVRVRAIYTDRVIIVQAGSVRTLRLAATIGEPAHLPLQQQNPLTDLDATGDDAASPDEYWREVRVLPNPAGGYIVKEIDAGSLYEKLGLQRGDVVYTLDMLRFVKLTELTRQNALTDVDEIKLEVQRNGRTTLLRYRLDGESSATQIR